jgi:hypothetical protein
VPSAPNDLPAVPGDRPAVAHWPAPLPVVARPIGSRRSGASGRGVVAGVLVVVLAGGGAGVLATVFGFWRLYGVGHLRSALLLGLTAMVIVAAHAACTVWALRTRPGAWSVASTQAPFVLAYGLIGPWWWVWVPLGVIPWATAATAAVGWGLVWYRRGVRSPRRAVVFLAGLGLLVVVNGVGIATVAWRATNGFGLVGQPNPWTAFDTLAGASCLSDNHFVWNGSRVVEADCPSGPNADFYAGRYDKGFFDETSCSGQPRGAFDKWWKWNQQYQFSFILKFGDDLSTVDGKRVGPPYPARQSGDKTLPAVVGGSNAQVTVHTRLTSALHPGGDGPYTIGVDHDTETWNVRLRRTVLGGWKVCQIDVSDPITATFTPN